MECGHYSIEFDRTGFPLIRKMGWNWSISLFPVSKYQFERFMAENGPQRGLYTDQWYRELLRSSPRRPWQRCNERQWELFITGVSYEEIIPFLKYLGQGFRLPEVSEWRSLLEVSDEIQRELRGLRISDCKTADLPINLWIKSGLFPLVKEGLLEMVKDGEKVCLIGKPYQGLHPNLWSSGTVRDIVDWDICRRMVGFRVAKELRI